MIHSPDPTSGLFHFDTPGIRSKYGLSEMICKSHILTRIRNIHARLVKFTTITNPVNPGNNRKNMKLIFHNIKPVFQYISQLHLKLIVII